MELLRKFGPYLAIEILMPGGTLLALLLYLARQRKMFLIPVSILGAAVRLESVKKARANVESEQNQAFPLVRARYS